MLLFKEKLGFTTVYSYKTIERAYSDIEVRQILEEIFELTNVPVADLEHEFGQTLQAMLRLVSRTMKPIVLKTNKQRLRESPLYDGLKYKVIVFFIFASRATGHELPYFERLLRETACWYGWLGLVVGDAAYLSRRNCDLVAAFGVVPRFYPKKGTTLRQKGSAA
ncbi:MAG: hypothetical protein LBH62_01995 [Nitrososphaerota archaeon]|jgi:hypothetical protein|nr:hypothetical protein [Nitrososphaerota archaeon]